MRQIKIIRNLCVAILCSSLLIGASGCVEPTQWVKNEGPTGLRDQQLAECMMGAERLPAPSDESVESNETRLLHWVSLCMRASGWKLEPGVPAQ
jgi:hypothetical protein